MENAQGRGIKPKGGVKSFALAVEEHDLLGKWVALSTLLGLCSLHLLDFETLWGTCILETVRDRTQASVFFSKMKETNTQQSLGQNMGRSHQKNEVNQR